MRMHALAMTLVAEAGEAGGWTLKSPAPGMFRPAIAAGARVTAGASIGTLDVLGRIYELVAPAGVIGHAAGVEPTRVQYGDAILALTPGSAVEVEAQAAATTSAITGLVFRAPTSGRFYGRSSPDKPPFVVAGAELARGATVCLLEVMKTFHRVNFGGADMPERVRVRELLVKDGDDVTAGAPLLALDPL